MKRLALVLAALVAPGVASAEGWETYDAPNYGFTMMVPSGTKVADKNLGDGWGLLHGENDGVHLYGAAHVGKHHDAKAIEAFGVKHTGVPADKWKKVDEGKTRGNWTWYNTVRAEHEGALLYGIYGIGPRGSYLLVLKTTAEDFKENRADYQTWYDSLTLTGGWEIYSSKEYGFSMLIPERSKVVEAEGEDGWGALGVTHAGIELHALGKLGTQATAEEIEAFGVKVSEIEAKHWKRIDKGENKRGWTWYQTVMVKSGDMVLVGGYGVGKKGSYLLLLTTTQSDYAKNKAAYDYWYWGIHSTK